MLASASVTLPVLHEMPLGLTTEPSVSTQSVKSWLPGVVAQLPTSTPRPVSFVTQGGTEVYVTSKRTTETLARSRAWEVPKVKPLSVDEANVTEGSINGMMTDSIPMRQIVLIGRCHFFCRKRCR